MAALETSGPRLEAREPFQSKVRVPLRERWNPRRRGDGPGHRWFQCRRARSCSPGSEHDNSNDFKLDPQSSKVDWSAHESSRSRARRDRSRSSLVADDPALAFTDRLRTRQQASRRAHFHPIEAPWTADRSFIDRGSSLCSPVDDSKQIAHRAHRPPLTSKAAIRYMGDGRHRAFRGDCGGRRCPCRGRSRDDRARHRGVVGRHAVRVVRLLSVRKPRGLLRRPVLSRRPTRRAQLLASLATFGAGFGVRPLGAVVFGHIGDLVGRKYTFLVTMATMGLARRSSASCRRTTRSGSGDGAARAPAPAAGPGARRRVRRRGHLRGRARAGREARLLHELHPDHGDAGLLPQHGRHRHDARHARRGGLQGLGLASARSSCRSSCSRCRSTSASR